VGRVAQHHAEAGHRRGELEIAARVGKSRALVGQREFQQLARVAVGAL